MEWISVKDRLPEERKEVWVKWRNNRTGEGYEEKTFRNRIYWNRVTAPECPWNEVLEWKPIERMNNT